mgnify:CR=1 FL=1
MTITNGSKKVDYVGIFNVIGLIIATFIVACILQYFSTLYNIRNSEYTLSLSFLSIIGAVFSTTYLSIFFSKFLQYICNKIGFLQ